MTPQELLKQTQLAAGVGDLTKWHGILIEKGRELKAAKEVIIIFFNNNQITAINLQFVHLSEPHRNAGRAAGRT